MDSSGYSQNVHSTVNELKVKYAGFWARFAAFLVDVIICLAIYAIPYAFLMALELYYNWSSDDPSEALVISSILLAAIVFCLYEALFLSSKWMATPGKMLLKIKVTDITGNRISFQKALGRSFIKYGIGILCSYFLSLFAVLYIFLVSPAFILSTPDRMALYDMAEHTAVVYNSANQGDIPQVQSV